jgi:hypothetical protein
MQTIKHERHRLVEYVVGVEMHPVVRSQAQTRSLAFAEMRMLIRTKKGYGCMSSPQEGSLGIRKTENAAMKEYRFFEARALLEGRMQ